MMPVPIVVATLRWNTNTAAKLKNAAQATAWCGFSTPVDTMVAMELAASWKPLMKSKASATRTRKTTTARPITAGSIAASSRMLEDDALDDVRHVLAAIGDQLEQLVDRAQLDELLHVGLLAEQARHRRAHHPVGVRFQPVYFLAGFQYRVGITQVGEEADGGPHAIAGHLADLRQLLRLGRRAPDVVQHHGLGHVLDQVQDVVHPRDEQVDLVAVERRDEGLVQQRDRLVGDL